MKTICLILGMMVVGCLKPLPPEPTPAVVVDVRHLPPIHNVQLTVEEDAAPPIKTWLSKEEVESQRLQQAIEKAAQEDPCQKGDPLCEYVP